MSQLSPFSQSSLVTATTGVVNSLLIPLQGRQLLLPNVNVAEVVSYAEFVPVDNKPDWFLGVLSWRGMEIPGVAFEPLNGEGMPMERERVAVLNGISGGDLGFYAMVVQGIPRLAKVKLAELEDLPEGSGKGPMEFLHVRYQGEVATIPDLDQLESVVAAAV